MKTRGLIIVLMLALILAAVGVAWASSGVEFKRSVLSGGASESASGGVSLRATLGQPIVGVVFGGDVTLGQGFWFGGTRSYGIYLPLVTLNH
jgi:hypothetical protein